MSLTTYSYAPYLAAYMGATLPAVGAMAAALYGMLAFAETQIINSIKLIKDGGEHHGKLLINVGTSILASHDIIADVRDVRSIMALGNDDLGEDDTDGNVICVDRHFSKAEGRWVEEGMALSLPGDAFRDKALLDWIIADKSGQETLVDDF